MVRRLLLVHDAESLLLVLSAHVGSLARVSEVLRASSFFRASFQMFWPDHEFIFELIQGQRPLAPEDHRWIPFIVYGFVSQLPAEFLSEGRRPVAAT